MKDKLTKVLESMNYPYFQQGTMNKEEGYPESYFTFKNMSSDGDAFYNNEEHKIELSGVFVQIGLVPSTAWLKDSGIELNERQEIIVDKFGSTNIPGIFAAGDCTDSAYKQIIISMGSGATAAIGAFDYLIRQ